MRRPIVWTTVVCTVLATSQAHAQLANNYILSLGVGGGATIPTGNAANTVKTGFNGQAYALVQLPGFFAFRFNFGYQKFDYNNNNSLAGVLGGSNTTNASRELLSGVGGVQISLLRGPVRPYLTAGIGAFDFRGATDSTGATSTSKINFGVDAGAGLAVALGRVSAFAEGRVQNVYTKNGGFIKSAKQINVVPVTFGLAVGLF